MAKILALFRRRSLLCAAKWHVATAGSVESGEGRDDEDCKTRKRSGIDQPAPRLSSCGCFINDAASRRPLTTSLHRILGAHVRNCRASSSACTLLELPRVLYLIYVCSRHVAMFWLASIDPPLILRRSIALPFALPLYFYSLSHHVHIIHLRPGSLNQPFG